MPVADPSGRGTYGPKKPAPKLKKQTKTNVRPPDSGDPLRRAPVVKERMFAHPQRPRNQKVIADIVHEDEVAKTKAKAVARRVKGMQAKPTPSPDALDTYRSPAQKKRDAQVVQRTVADSRIKVIRAQHKGEGARALKKAALTPFKLQMTPERKVSYEDAVKLRAKGVKVRDAKPGENIGASVGVNTIAGRPTVSFNKDTNQKRLAPVLKVLEQTTRVNHAIAGGVDAAVKGTDISSGVTRGIQNKDKKTFHDVFTDAGWNPKSGAGKTLKSAAALTADITTDPTTYATFGTGSIAAKAGEKVASKAAKVEVKAAAQAAEKAARVAAPTSKEARRAAARAQGGGALSPTLSQQARSRVTRTGDQRKGVTVKFAGKEVPGVRKAAAHAARPVRAVARTVVPERVRAGGRAVLADLNPDVVPAGVSKETSQKTTQAIRTARSKSNRGLHEAQQMALGLRKLIGEDNYSLVIDAIEAKKIGGLPDELRAPARRLRDQFRYANRQRRQAGIKGGEIKERAQIPVPEVVADTNESAKVLGKARRAEARAQRDVERAVSEQDIHQGRAEVLSRNVSGSTAEKVAERGRRTKRKSRFVTVAEPLDAAAQKSIARNQRKGQAPVDPNVETQQYIAFLEKDVADKRRGLGMVNPGTAGERQMQHDLDEAVRKLERAKQFEKVTGSPHLPEHEAQWFHGTPRKFEGTPTAENQWSDLGVYLTSDPKYARGYAGGGGHVVPLRAQPRKVLDWRAGRENQAELKSVVDAMHEQAVAAHKIRRAETLKGGGTHYPTSSATMKTLETWARLLGEGKPLTAEASRNLQHALQDASVDIGEALGMKGTGRRHQVLASTLRKLGYDAVRKVDQHADALVVLDEKAMRRVTGTEGVAAARKVKVPGVPSTGAKYAGGGYGVQQTATAAKDAGQRLTNTTAARAKAEEAHAKTVADAAEQRAARALAEKTNAKRAKAPKDYIPHHVLTEDELKGTAHAGGVGRKVINPDHLKTRKDNRPLSVLREESPHEYDEDLARVFARYKEKHATAVARAELNRRIADLGTTIKRGSKGVPEDASVYHIVGSDISAKLTKDEVKKVIGTGTHLGGERAKGRYVILNDDLVKRAIEGVQQGKREPGIVTGLDKFQAGWKSLALGTPGFHVRNFVGDTSNAYVHQPGRRLPANMKHARRVLHAEGRNDKALRTLGKTSDEAATIKLPKYGAVTYDEVARQLAKHGAMRSGFTARDISTLTEKSAVKMPKLPSGKTRAFVKRQFLNREDLPRVTTAINALRDGATWEEAAQRVADVHIDYGHLTAFERQVARRAMPFYTFTARNIPIQAKGIVTRPGKYANYEKTRAESAKLTGMDEEYAKAKDLTDKLKAAGVKLPDGWEAGLSEWEQRNAGIPVSYKGHKFTVSMGLPLADLNEFPGAALSSQLYEYYNKGLSLATPVAKNVVEYMENHSFFFRDKIERDNAPLVAAPSYIRWLPPHLKKMMGVTENYVDPKTGKRTLGYNAKADYVVKMVPGTPAFLNKMATDGHDRVGKGKGGKILSWVGVKASPYDPITNAVNLAFERGGQIDKDLNRLRKTYHPDNDRYIGATNPTPEYTRLMAQKKITDRIAYQGRMRMGWKKLPSTGGPRKPRGGSGGIKIPGVGGSGYNVPGVGGSIKVPTG